MHNAWTVYEHGEPSAVLRWEVRPAPAPGAGQIRVRVAAASCNFADVLLCRGTYQQKPPTPFTPGLEVCGVIEAVGAGVDTARLGARVVGQPHLPYGGFAETALMHDAHAYSVPAGIDEATAATVHLTYLTAWLGLHRRASVQPGDVVVVTAAAGGVGSAAVQLAKAAGATVIGIASGPAKLKTVKLLGADIAIDGSADDVVDRVKASAPCGAAVVFDPVGGGAFDAATKYIGFEGIIVVVGFASGTIPAPRLNHAFVKNYTLAGLHWSLYQTHQPRLLQHAQTKIFELAASGEITPFITTRIGFGGVPTALDDLGAGRTHGKTVITAHI